MYLDLPLHFQYSKKNSLLHLYTKYHFKHLYAFNSFLSCLFYNFLPIVLCLEFCSIDTRNK